MKKKVKNLYLYLKYGNHLLKKKVTPPEQSINKFVLKFLIWLVLVNTRCIPLGLSLFFLPSDLDPTYYLKISQIPVLVCLMLNQVVWKLINESPTSWIINENAANLVSQLESISILITVVYMLLFIGVMAYNTFSKIEMRNKFFRGLRKRFGNVNMSQITRRQNRRKTNFDDDFKERRKLISNNESALGLNLESESDAFGNLESMGIF